uniref:Phage head morphogenesis domain-containing protein n=1 Tax=uncultured marine virus TaxID=186617 RepID=A0A0F7L771_9VIRU|nr:hypothetical protein P12026_05 [uncultured marine virus]
MKINRNKWQTDFEKQLDRSEKRQLSKVKKYYKGEYKKGIESFVSEGQTNFALLFDDKDLLKIYRDLYTDIGLRFAKWYAKNYDKYLTKGVNPNQYVDQWTNKFASFGTAVGAQRVTLVSGTAKKTLIGITQQLMRDPEFMSLGNQQKGRILNSQFSRYSKNQAERLVRTEATAAANFATMESATTIFPGSQMRKEWIASFDDRTRSTHSEAGSSDPIPYNDPFMVGGSFLMYPGDPSGPAAEVINCRCSVAPFPVKGAQTVGEISDINFGMGGGSTTGIGLTDVVSAINATLAGVGDTVVESVLNTVKEFKSTMIDKFSEFNIKIDSIRGSSKLSMVEYNKINNKLSELFSKYNFAALENQQTVKLSFSSGARTYGFVERYSVSGNLTRINLGDLLKDLPSRIRVSESNFTRRWFSAIDADKMFLSTPVHEMTHVLLHSSMKSGNQKIALDKIRIIRKNYYDELKRLKEANKIKQYNDIYIGRYALHSFDEFIAEAFTEYNLNSNPSKYARLVGEVMDQYLKK